MRMYRTERIDNSMTRIIDIAGVACYLIEGTEKACLLDTCCGYGDLKKTVSELTDKEVFVILTHGHYDHTGSASLFDKVYMSHLDLPVLRYHNENRAFFLECDREMIPALEHITMDRVNPLPACVPEDIDEGREFDLGGIHIRMIHVGGHTPGIMCPLIPEKRVIFFGDACGMNVLLHEKTADKVSVYRNGLQKLKNLEPEYDMICRNHGTFTNGKTLLDNVMDCCDLILRDEDAKEERILYGKTVYSARPKSSKIQGNIIYAEEKRG